MADLNVYGGENYNIGTDVGSGVGFFGAGGFGYSVQVNKFNARTYITNASGSSEGPEIDNLMWTAPTGVIWGTSGEEHQLTEIPNDKATVNIKFTHTSSVDIQNAVFRAFDGVSVDNAPSGCSIRAFEIIHDGTTYSNDGSGDTHWIALSGADSTLSLSDSPGTSGVYANAGGTGSDTRHDWYIGTTLMPTSIGEKTGSFYVYMEYL